LSAIALNKRRSEGRKYFFFEKKKQKTFARCADRRRFTPTSKSFLVLFFKKELLSLQTSQECSMNRLKALHDTAGQAPWLDYVRRDLIESGDLATLIERDGLRGMTSNPSIFEKAIGHSEAYASAIGDMQKEGDHGISALYETLAMADIRAAADVLRTVYDATKHEDGYISLEVSPYLANDTDATIAEALRLWSTVDRPNLMVKVPATPAGIPAIRHLIGQGLNINVTLLFAIEAYEQVVEAYLSGLEDLQKRGGNLVRVASVASFFVSRIDTAVDKALAAKNAPAPALADKVAIANAKLAYVRFKALFAGPRWERLQAAGAHPQRLLWASTSTKKKELRDTLYVEQLIGRHTVNTMPPATMDAFRDHGEVLIDEVEKDLDGAHATINGLRDAGVSLDDITTSLVADGVQQFADAFDGLLGAVARRRRELSDGKEPTFRFEPGSETLASAYAGELERWRHDGLIRKLWHGDAALWTGADEAKWIGWLPIVEQELQSIAELRRFTEEVRSGGFTDVVLLGMGGSSLGPEVLAETFGPELGGRPRFHMLDSTDPAQIKTLADSIALPTSLFIVSSKSGSTLEPNIYCGYFLTLAKQALGAAAARHFVAVTDPGSSLEKHATQEGFLHIFHGVKSIGGRYSVLSKFGLVPAAAIGIDVERLLKTTQLMVRSCAEDVPPAEDPGVKLGVALGVAARSFGRDKVTLIASPGIADVGAWLEQLLAESTGKQGHGLVPVDREPLAAPDHYGNDRFFAYLELAGKADEGQRAAVAALAAAGHPVATMVVKDIWHVGGEFFRWEVATAVAGAVIGINPFDQPDVEASKIKTRALTDAYEQQGSLPAEAPIFQANGISLYADSRNATALGRHNDLDGYLRSHFAQVKQGDYVALLAYIERNDAHSSVLTSMRSTIRDRTKAATCVGFGPRFLHSTGQAYKGGPNSGVFLQVTCDDAADIAVPDHKYSFGIVKAAQARGDLGVLEERGRRALRVHLHDVSTSLGELARAVEQVLN
jgi:transaldolase/glucose-6-phosphate isomerase